MKTPDSPEHAPENRKRLRGAVERALARADKEPGPERQTQVNQLVELVLSERVSLRETIAGEILEPLIDRYDEGLNNDQMETLVWVVRHFVRGPDGEITLDKPPPNARKAGLRVV